MAYKLKFNLFNFLFRLVSFLADKTGGWTLFVRPKLLLGSVLLGLSTISCNSKKDTVPQAVVSDVAKPESIHSQVFCYHMEKMPIFPGGERELYKFIQANLQYPVTSCYEQPIQGRVVVRFTVLEDGSIENVEVLRSLDPNCDKEAVRLVKSMPKWIPGEQNGRRTKVYFTLPITFKLPE
jgi:protein TonB